MRYIERPRERQRVSYAARYEPGESLDELLAVARRLDSDAVITEVSDLGIIVVRYLNVPDNHPAHTDYEVVEAGKFLVYSETFHLLYSHDAESFAKEHEPAPS